MHGNATQQFSSHLDVNALDVTVPDRMLVRDLSFSLPRESWLAILGSNGSGKTRALETLCRLHGNNGNAVSVNGTSIDRLSSSERAQQITLVTQQQNDAFDNHVLDNVLLGRYALRTREPETLSDPLTRADEYLAALDLTHVRNATTQTLSGGERQRVAIAQALMQDTPLLLLDEPLSHQDPANAQRLLHVLASLQSQGKTLVSSLHDINIARRFATHALLLDGRGGWQFGRADAILTAEHLSALYGIQMHQIETAAGSWLVPDLST